MGSDGLHLRHPRREHRSLCGLSLGPDQVLAAVAILSAQQAIELACDESARPACRACLLVMLGAALPRHGVQFLAATSLPTLDAKSLHRWSGPRLRARREAAGLSRAHVAHLSRLTEATIRNVESGRHRPSWRVLALLMSVPQLVPSSTR